ncbi:MAG: hypothetical protein LBE04_04725 [Prevotellaceae bacterium]|jgi:hypothetical protein|nr:hypothetical protein [Prevotellaceae bacterium]
MEKEFKDTYIAVNVQYNGKFPENKLNREYNSQADFLKDLNTLTKDETKHCEIELLKVRLYEDEEYYIDEWKGNEDIEFELKPRFVQSKVLDKVYSKELIKIK